MFLEHGHQVYNVSLLKIVFMYIVKKDNSKEKKIFQQEKFLRREIKI